MGWVAQNDSRLLPLFQEWRSHPCVRIGQSYRALFGLMTMAEMIAIIGEAIVLVVEILAAWAHAMFEGLIVLACFIFSRSFRAKRLEEWRLLPRKKVSDLFLASLWAAVVIGLPLFLLVRTKDPPTKGEPVAPVLAKAGTNDDLRIDLRTKRTNHQETVGTVVVKKGGVSKILGTKSVGELKTQLVENVSLVRTSPTNANLTTNK